MNNSILFVAVIFLLSLLIPVDLDARAGGGGSYRSSGSSSSSSSSRSSYSGSSSSSYRSSSSSSYRSSSGSRSSSSSSYRPSKPSYLTIRSFDSVERVLNFQAPGKLVLREKLTAKIPRLSDEPGYELDFSGPQEPWKIDSVRETTGVFDSVREAHHSILTGPKKNAAGTKQLEFFSMASYAATPTLSGSTLVFTSNALCLNAAKCKIELSGLSPLDRVELSYRDATKGIKEVTTKNFDNVSLQGVYALTIRFAGNHHKSAAQAAWQKAECQFETETHLRMDSSGILSHSENILNPKDTAYICYTLHLSFSTEQFLLKNVKHLLYADSSPLELRLRGNIREFGYEALGAIASGSADAAELTIPLPALYLSTDNYPQISARNITTRKHIFVQTPPDVVASFKLFACENSEENIFPYIWEPPCKTVRPLSFHESRQDNRITLTPDEAQTQKTWLLIGSIQKGAFASPNILTKLQFAFGNYHTIGDYPRWVFWFYFSSIVVGIILAIFIFRYLALRKRRILSQNAENARQTNAERIEDFVTREIQKHDPAFDIEAFKARGRTIAEKIQSAWCAGDMSSCRRYLSQGVYNRFRTQLKIMREIEKKQNAMADFSPSAYVRSGPYDAIAVRLDAKARDTMLDATINPTDALAMAKRAPLTRFSEDYTFMRRHDAQTTQKENA
ncbi:MAG TPA: TIM44-like domain-containing protein, partial [Turneriella sp.]|nr:TIM44-like domain-containing protein [Turneriella sp.]